ncbi:protein stunted isoform X2 [Calliphora vicina]|uniref:protein stunted isoform X2 n=1 Tax=Calliphora vicina TaxID=7373 RepID=UPI00325BE75F
MTNAWRAAGITYIQYSNICAKVVRQALKSELRVDAAKRSDSHVRFTPWTNGKPAHEK